MSANASELDFLRDLLPRAWRLCGSLDDAAVMDKAAFDLVTQVDLRMEASIIRCIRHAFPGDKILSEETLSSTAVTGRTWTIDPIDGTSNMAGGLPLFGVQCALYDGEDIAASAIYLPRMDELFSAEKGQGAHLNGAPIAVRPQDAEHSLISFGDFPHARPEEAREQFALMNRLMPQVGRCRMFGSACIDFAFLAAGRTQGTILFTRNRWDLAPGLLLAKEAGAVICSPDGAYSPESRAVIACADEALYRLIYP